MKNNYSKVKGVPLYLHETKPNLTTAEYKNIPKVSFNNPINGKQGTYYNQRIKVSKVIFDKLRDIVEAEIATNYPNSSKYVFSETDTIYLNRLYSENNVCFLTLTTLRFLKLYIKDKRVNINYNTYLYIE